MFEKVICLSILILTIIFSIICLNTTTVNRKIELIEVISQHNQETAASLP